MSNDDVLVSQDLLMELVYWARRYCDGRASYAASGFNALYKELRSKYPDMVRCKDKMDTTLMGEGKYWPYAQDGMYDEKNGVFDAR